MDLKELSCIIKKKLSKNIDNARKAREAGKNIEESFLLGKTDTYLEIIIIILKQIIEDGKNNGF